MTAKTPKPFRIAVLDFIMTGYLAIKGFLCGINQEILLDF
jgi:hypothetical protein